MRKFVLAAPFLLCACAAPYAPQTIGTPADQARYGADVAICVAAAKAYKPDMDVAGLGAAAVNGAANNSAETLVPPVGLVPALGAAGGAAGALASGFDLMGQARRNVAKHCILELTHRDHSALIADPDN